MLDCLSGERILLGIEFHRLADTELQGIIAHAARPLQAIEYRSPSLLLRQALHEYLRAADTVESTQVIVKVVRVGVGLLAGVDPGHVPLGMQRRAPRGHPD